MGGEKGDKMRCLACGKVIRSKDSIIHGYGPVCYQNIFGKDPREKQDKEKLQLDGQISVEDLITGSES
jgi:hypothetical protein